MWPWRSACHPSPASQDLQASDRDALALLALSAVFSGYDGARLERALTQASSPWPTAQAAPP